MTYWHSGTHVPEESQTETRESPVLRVGDVSRTDLHALLQPQGLTLTGVETGVPIPGSHWGDEEAGLIGYRLYFRDDTPVHSILHEACHWLLMSDARRATLHTDAKGTAAEEDAVCYLQILLADHVPGMGQNRMLADMDAWGYSFRLGSARRWFEADAEDAALYLASRGLPESLLL